MELFYQIGAWLAGIIIAVSGGTGVFGSINNPVTITSSTVTNVGGIVGLGATSSLAKFNGVNSIGVATSSTDYAPATLGTNILKGNGSGGFSMATSSTDYAPVTLGTNILKGNGSGGFNMATSGNDYQSPISVVPNLTFNSNVLNTVQDIQTTSSVQFATVSSTNASYTTASTTQLGFFGDGSIKKTGYEKANFSYVNATTSVNFTHRYFFTSSTLVGLSCDTAGGASSTLSASISATSSVLGTDVMGGINCSGAGFTTSTFSNSSISNGKYLLFSATTTNATTTLNVSMKFQDL